jgi:lactate dehydrogenase-like 2-hydroxyacid dehydrogenase
MAKPSVVVTRRWPAEVEAELAERYDAVFNTSDRPLRSDELKEALYAADAVLPTVSDRLDADVFDVTKPRAQILANFGVGYSHIDIASAKRHAIAVTNTPDVLSECTADLAITLMLMVARRASEGEQQLRARAWQGWCPTHMLGTKVSGKTLGIVGFGRIGREVAKRAHHGFGMRVIFTNRSPVDPQEAAAVGATPCASLDELLAEADFVSLHCPGGRENRRLIDARRLGQMKPGAFLINTSRGEVVDEQALVQALWFETIAGAGLDVYDGEPCILPELRSCPNAVLLPHLGSATRDTRTAMGRRVLRNLDAFFNGEEPLDRVA